jgi:hypothetical protein
MDFSWMPYFNAFWIFPLLCFFFMVIMMAGCHGMRFRRGHGARNSDRSETARQILERRHDVTG